MPISRRLAALLVAAALAVPATAAAQSTTSSGGKADVSTTPPVPLSDSGGNPSATANELPNTGSDPRVLLLCGAALTLIGAGLRLRTADADAY